MCDLSKHISMQVSMQMSYICLYAFKTFEAWQLHAYYSMYSTPATFF